MEHLMSEKRTTEPYIPPWDVCSMGSNEGRQLSALEQFVHDYEPAADEESEEWRDLLRNVLQERDNQHG